ncbi:MAG TPA: phosphotransferase, partial [Micropepsaceae bacterium]|nr:phosphotransferase [Micropepsaceae bacterium]
APAAATPDQRRALGYNALARLAGADCGRFVAAADYLRRCGLNAPEILAADISHGFLLIEDLGNDLYTDVLQRDGDERGLYQAAIDALIALHELPAPAQLSPEKPLFPYDEAAMLAEIDLLTDWYFPLALGRAADAAETDHHRALWSAALKHLDGGPRVFVHRDYHAQNLLWRGSLMGLARVGIIDFQDAVAGSPAYDLVSLLEDARRDVSPELGDAMTAHYLDRSRCGGGAAARTHFRASAAVLAAQRNVKIAGIFARLAKRDAKPRYLAHLPRVWRYLERDLRHDVLAPVRDWYDATIPAAARNVREAAP